MELMDGSQFDNCDEIETTGSPKQRRLHTVDPSSLILKSAMLSKKGVGFIIGNAYKPRLFELHTNGELIYYEIKPNGQKIRKGDILITSQTRIEKRYGGKRREAKFIIHSTNRSFYIWCNHITKTPKNNTKTSQTPKPCNAIYKFNNKHKSTPKNAPNNSRISLSNAKNKTLYPYPYLSNQKTDKKSPLTLSKESFEYIPSPPMTTPCGPNITGKQQALEWCDILLNIVSQKQKQKEYILLQDLDQQQPTTKNDTFQLVEKQRSNSCPLRSNTSGEYICNETEYDANTIWTLKESYVWSKGDGYYSDQYTAKYFVLRINGKLDWYYDQTMIDKKGSIDILNSCMNVEKRKGSKKRDCKLIVFTRRRNYYFWCKDDKKLSDEWYHMIRLIISDKIKIEISVTYRNSSVHNSLSVNVEEYKEEDDDYDDDIFIPQLFYPNIYGDYTSILQDGVAEIHKWLALSYSCYDWQLLYSSSIDGYSMITFYEKCSDSGPCILIIKDENGYIFGVFLSDSICLDHKLFFGNGETFVFNIYPDIKKYEWNGINRFFINCRKDTLTFGGGDNGHSALVLTDNFRYGISQKSQTFNNNVLSKNIDFSPCVVEVWTFKNYW